ncbi:helix-turn-helix domain-containing protein [Cryptosporangium phraense]|uniref:Helix-turn-helix transcriptional regulator n=1 Tax=Cryptosporangium phraense TaxID=2593070 RepID=A0A545ASN2_9ACTN|nr:helix-turn-helix transcriptional regulator [Cryptosporangium phraense]TQS44352.1 helix-turn-helix transcriptional regulator [Cryptosporangium phraense]
MTRPVAQDARAAVIGNHLLDYRARHGGMPLVHLARQIGLPPVTLADIETGHRASTYTQLRQIARGIAPNHSAALLAHWVEQLGDHAPQPDV